MVDSGSSYMLLNKELWQTIKEEDKNLNPWDGKPMYLADGGGGWSVLSRW